MLHGIFVKTVIIVSKTTGVIIYYCLRHCLCRLPSLKYKMTMVFCFLCVFNSIQFMHDDDNNVVDVNGIPCHGMVVCFEPYTLDDRWRRLGHWLQKVVFAWPLVSMIFFVYFCVMSRGERVLLGPKHVDDTTSTQLNTTHKLVPSPQI